MPWQLTPIFDAPGDDRDRPRAYRLHQPGSPLDTTHLAQVGGQIIISGPLSPGSHGVVGPKGLDLMAFAVMTGQMAASRVLPRTATPRDRGKLLDIHSRFADLWCADGGPGGAL